MALNESEGQPPDTLVTPQFDDFGGRNMISPPSTPPKSNYCNRVSMTECQPKIPHIPENEDVSESLIDLLFLKYDDGHSLQDVQLDVDAIPQLG